MERKTAGLLGAVATLATMGAAHAVTPPPVNPAETLHAASYADLLAPVQNAVAVMRADDAARTQQPRPDTKSDPDSQSDPNIKLAQGYYYGPPAYHHHHHHHHHAYYHHHHHHHHSSYVGIPGVGGVVVR